jgi:hypothetical protein
MGAIARQARLRMPERKRRPPLCDVVSRHLKQRVDIPIRILQGEKRVPKMRLGVKVAHVNLQQFV